MKKFLNALYENVSLIVYGIIITYLCVVSFFNTCYTSIDYREYTFYLSDKPIRNLLFILITIICLYFIKKSGIVCKINNNKKLFLIIKYVLLLLILILGITWVLNTRFYPAADQYSVQKSVVDFINRDYSAFVGDGYISKNHVQCGLFLLSYLFALIFGEMNIIAIEIVNVVACVFIFKSLSEIVGIYKGSHCMQLIVLSCGILFPVVILYSYFIYGNIIGLAFAILAIKYELMFIKNGRITDCLVSSLCIFLAIMCKSTYEIYFIAMMICLVFNIINEFDYKKIIYLGLLVLALVSSLALPTKFIEGKTGYKMSDGISFYSYIAMGMQEGERAPGWYNGYNYDSYAECNNDSLKQKEFSKKEIDKRIDVFVNDIDYASKFYTKKIVSEWNNPTYQVFWNIQDKFDGGFSPNLFVKKIVSLKGTYTFQKYLNIVDSIIKFGSLMFVLYLIFNKNNSLLILPITFVGGFLFLSFLSEAKAQYAIMFSILLVPMSIMGYNFIVNSIIEKNNIFKNLMVLFFVVLTIISSIVVSKKEYLSKDDGIYYEYVISDGNFDYISIQEHY